MRARVAERGPPDVKRSSSVGSLRKGSEVRSTATARKVRSSNLFRILDESPRQVSWGLFLFVGLAACAVARDSAFDERPGCSFRRVAYALLLFLMVYCMLITRDGVMERPHPAVWRLLHGWNLWYCLLATVFLVVPVSDGVVLMQWLFPGVERPTTAEVPETIGLDHLKCAINVENVKRQLFSLWFFAHVVGWWAKMLMLRDLKMCIVYSTMFELTELTLQFLVPEFQECWWDSLIMDWLIANTLIGMMSGKLTLRILNVSEFNWTPAQNQRLSARVVQFFTPASWSEYAWNPSNDPITSVLNSAIWIVMAIAEVNSFFLINILHLPREHPFNVTRQALLCLCAVPAVEEWYEYTRHARAHYLGREWFEYTTQYKGRKPRIGHFTWLLSITVCLETTAVVKYSVSLGRLRSAGPGVEIWGPWAAFFLLFGAYFLTHCWLFYRQERAYPVWLRVLRWASLLPLLALLRLYAF